MFDGIRLKPGIVPTWVERFVPVRDEETGVVERITAKCGCHAWLDIPAGYGLPVKCHGCGAEDTTSPRYGRICHPHFSDEYGMGWQCNCPKPARIEGLDDSEYEHLVAASNLHDANHRTCEACGTLRPESLDRTPYWDEEGWVCSCLSWDGEGWVQEDLNNPEDKECGCCDTQRPPRTGGVVPKGFVLGNPQDIAISPIIAAVRELTVSIEAWIHALSEDIRSAGLDDEDSRIEQSLLSAGITEDTKTVSLIHPPGSAIALIKPDNGEWIQGYMDTEERMTNLLNHAESWNVPVGLKVGCAQAGITPGCLGVVDDPLNSTLCAKCKKRLYR